MSANTDFVEHDADALTINWQTRATLSKSDANSARHGVDGGDWDSRFLPREGAQKRRKWSAMRIAQNHMSMAFQELRSIKQRAGSRPHPR